LPAARCELAADDPQSQRSIGDIREMDNLIDSALAVFSHQEASEPPRTTDVFSLVQSLTDDLADLGQPVALSGGQAVATVQPIALRRGGSGLGLFIARDLLSRQGGRLMLANRETGGLRATIVVPKRPASGQGGENNETSR
jgi:hypothetical protein